MRHVNDTKKTNTQEDIQEDIIKYLSNCNDKG